MTDKLAQRRSKLKKLREKVNLSGKAVEHFSPEFQQIMDVLREVDDGVREIAMGEKGSDPGQTLKDLIRVADTNFKRREYMVAISYLGRFHERVEAINVEFAKLTMNVDTIHHRFLFEDVDPDQVEYLTRSLAPKFHKHKTSPAFAPSWLKDKKEPKKAADDTSHTIVVEANIIGDWWHNILSDRGKTLAGWEKRFPKYSREIKSQTSSMIARSQALFDNLLTTLKQLDTYRSTRKLEEYMQTAQKWRERYRGYNAAFIAFYNSQIRRFIDYQEDMQKKKELAEAQAKEQLEQADTEFQGKNTPKEWPPQTERSATPSAAKGKEPMPLAPLAKDDPLPSWDDLPPGFQELYTELQMTTKKMKPWDEMKPNQQRLYYNAIVMKIQKENAKKNVAFPPINPPPPSPLKVPEVSSESASPAVQEPPSIMAPAPVVSPPSSVEETPTRIIRPVSVHSLRPITPPTNTGTLRSPGIQQDTLNSPPPSDFYYPPAVPPPTRREPEDHTNPVINLVNPKIPPPSDFYYPPAVPPPTRREPEDHTNPVINLVNPKIPPPPQLPKDMVGTSRPRKAHTDFITALEAKASEHPIVQAVFILDYAKEIEQDEPEQCNKLRTLASSILGS